MVYQMLSRVLTYVQVAIAMLGIALVQAALDCPLP